MSGSGRSLAGIRDCACCHACPRQRLQPRAEFLVDRPKRGALRFIDNETATTADVFRVTLSSSAAPQRGVAADCCKAAGRSGPALG